MPDVWSIMRAVRGANLPAPAKHVLLTLASLADPQSAVIPERFTPSLSELASMTALGRSTVARALSQIDAESPEENGGGWVKRLRPSVHDARANGAKTQYALLVPGSPPAGLVPERDYPDQPKPDTPVVPERDGGSPAAGHEVPTTSTSTTKTSSSSAKPRKSAPKKAEPYREDVERLCTHLADRVAQNGSPRPDITDRWRKEARLLLDDKKRNPPITLEKALRAVDWCQNDSFWRSNIRSMPKFREKYDTLRLQALDQKARRSGGMSQHEPYQNPPKEAYDSWNPTAIPQAS